MKDVCFERAREVLHGNSSRLGIMASGEWYKDVWGRDGLITCLGMGCSEDERLFQSAKTTINTIAKFQKDTGQLPNKFSPDGKKTGFGEGGCVDASLWFPLAVLNYYENTNDKKFLLSHLKGIDKCISWLNGLDQNNDCLIETNEGSDWLDCLIRSGRVLYDEVLYYAALKARDRAFSVLGKDEKYQDFAEKVRRNINLFFWPEEKNLEPVRRMYGYTGVEKDFETVLREGERDYYFAELGFRRYDPRCDVFANTLAIIFDVADKKKKNKIFGHFNKEKVHEPFPVRVLTPPISDDFFRPFHYRWTEYPYLQEPGNYHNGGIWPFVGGFFVIALKKEGRKPRAMLEKLAEANRVGKSSEYEFNEWLNWKGTPMGSAYQSWSAGMYILAYQYANKKIKLL